MCLFLTTSNTYPFSQHARQYWPFQLSVVQIKVSVPDCQGEWEENSVQDLSRGLASHKIDNNARPSKNLWKKCVGAEKWQRQKQRNCGRPLGEEIMNQ